MSARIFISYRRADTLGFNHAIYNKLGDHFGAENVFMDVDDIEPGEDFPEILEDAVNACDVMVVLIGPDWLTITDAEGNRRLDNPLDFVRIEVSRGLERNIKVIPVLVKGAHPLRAEDLPENLKPLARLQVLFVREKFDRDIEGLVRAIKNVLEKVPETQESPVMEEEPPISKSRKGLPKWVLFGGGFVSIGVIALLLSGIIDFGGGGETPIVLEDTPTPTTENEDEPALSTNTPEPTPTKSPVESFTNPFDKMVYHLVPAGEFMMGSDDGEPDESRAHLVYVADFYIGETEVTNASYQICYDADVCKLPENTNRYNTVAYAQHPVVYVDWAYAQTYCKWAGGDMWDGRLPTEAQWEKAARGGLEGKKYPWGDTNPVSTTEAENGANIAGFYYQTVPVRSFAPNGYGLFDMAGNVFEWVSSCYKAYPYDPEDGRENSEDDCIRVARGGSWYNGMQHARVAFRGYFNPDDSYFNFGFRCVLSEKP